MPKASGFQNLIEKVWGQYGDDVGKSLIHLGAVGWFFSAVAQIGMIATNKDIEKKEKKFLIPQEIADGVINVGLYYSICQAIKYIGDSVAENSAIMTQTTEKTIRDINREVPSTVGNFVDGVVSELKRNKIIESSKKQNLTDFFKGSIEYLKQAPLNKDSQKRTNNDLTIIKNAFDKFVTPEQKIQQIEILEKAQRNFKQFKNGLGVITSVGASIIACNMITPVARNITANYYQKKLMKERYLLKKKKAIQPEQKPYCDNSDNMYGYTHTVSPAFSVFKI